MRLRRSKLPALAFGCILALIAAELVLRFVPNSANLYGTSVSYVRDSALGYTLSPRLHGAKCVMSCTHIEGIETNTQGFRDTEWRKDSAGRIAILGDSFMEGLHLSAGDNVSGILEKMLGLEVMNTGISGYGTVAQLMVWRNVLRPMKPSVVIVFFFAQNDFLNNHCALDVATGTYRTEPCPCGTISPEGAVTYHLDHPDGVTPVKPGWLEQNWYLYKYLKNRFSKPGKNETSLWKSYLGPWEGQYRESRDITLQVFRDFRREVEAEGAKLLLVSVPDYLFMTGDNWRSEISEVTRWDSIPGNFDPGLPLRELDTLARQAGIPLLRLEDVFGKYLQWQQLPAPYLCLRCDGHWNPAGHFIAANAVVQTLFEQNILSVDSLKKSQILTLADQNLQLKPVEILGDKAWNEIYVNGSFSGETKIGELLKR